MVMFKPVVLLIQDTLSHEFCEAIHIATVHAIYGNNHLQKDIADSNNDTSKHHNRVITEEAQLHVSSHETTFQVAVKKIEKDYPYSNTCRVKNGFILKFSPPPKFS